MLSRNQGAEVVIGTLPCIALRERAAALRPCVAAERSEGDALHGKMMFALGGPWPKGKNVRKFLTLPASRLPIRHDYTARLSQPRIESTIAEPAST